MGLRLPFAVSGVYWIAFAAIVPTTCTSAATSAGQTLDEVKSDTRPSTAIARQRSKEFDRWITEIATKRDQSREGATLAEQAVRERIASELYTSHDAVRAAVRAWISYGEQIARTDSTKRPGRYKEALRCVNELLPLLAGVDGSGPLRAELCLLTESLLRGENTPEPILKAAEDALKVLEPVQTAIDLMALNAHARLGDAFVRQGDRKSAEKQYMLAIRYRWFLITDGRAYAAARDIYRSSFRGAMDCRRGNSEGLKELSRVFVPSAGSDLKTELDERIREADHR